MKMFPLPNFFDRGLSGGQYNYVFSSETAAPKQTYTLKLDYNLNPKNLLFFTFSGYSESNDGYINVPGWTESWEQIGRSFRAGNKGLGARYTRIFTPAISNEFHWGWFMNPESLTSPNSEIKRNQRDTVGFTAGQFYPKVNLFNFIPNATYGGVPRAAELNINGRFPIDDPYNSFTWTDKLSIIRGAHTAKVGILVDWFGLGRASNANQFGAFNFARNANNPLDTNWAYSNAILGVFNTYTESSALPYMNARGGRVEWFVQDNWRIAKRLTLDFGVRMSRFVPIHERDNHASAFIASRFNSAKQVRLIAPGRDAQGRRAGVHPVTGQIYPDTLIGAIAPGVGDPANGMVVAGTDSSLPATLLQQRGWHVGPRVGFAYDPFGKGRTSIRGGFGVSYTQSPMNQWQPLSAQEPLVQNPTVYYGAISTLLSTSGFLFPTAVTSVDPAGHVPTVMNFSLSVQHNVGFDTVLDVAYVGSLGRHLLWSRNLNGIPYGANFKPENIDPATKLPYAAAFLRPTAGFNNINLLEHSGTSNYHSLQVSANRRFARNLQFGFAWCWSKAMDYVDADGGGISTFVPIRVWNYGLAGFDRTHTVKINWLYDLPRAPWNNILARGVLRGWQLSGITTFQSGAPAGVGYSTTTGADITGSPTEGSRIVVTGNPVLPKSERTFNRFFRTDVFRVPAVGTWGNAAKTMFRGPGINNWDISVFKNFAVREGMKFQLRCEAYNAFNHMQFSGVNATARFDAAGAQVNPILGQLTAARSPRLMQLALRFMF